MSNSGLPNQSGAGGQPSDQLQIPNKYAMTNGIGVAAMSHLAQDLPFYIPQNMHLSSERPPQWNHIHRQLSPQELQQWAILNLAHQQQQQQWPSSSGFYPQQLQALQERQQQHQQQMAPVVQRNQIAMQSSIEIENAEDTKKQQQLSGIEQNPREKRTLSDNDIELVEAAEMDKDPNTRVVIGSVSKKARKAIRQNRTSDTQNTQRSLQFTTQHKGQQEQQANSMKTTRQDYQHTQVQQPPQGQTTEIGPFAPHRDQVQVSNDARQFANTRYPFSPFGITLVDDVRDKVVVEHLVKVAKDKFDFTLEIAGYRRTKVNEGFKVLIFVKTVNSFTYLLDKKTWPSELGGKMYSLALPNIPPQLSLVLPFVPYKTDMQELMADIQSMHPEVVNVIRLKNRQQQMIKAVKLELNSDVVRKQILGSKKLLVGGISYQVEEYMAQAHVLVCSQCMGIGHFRKNCPQQQMHTCNVCGDISTDIQLHKQNCTGISKCIHCGGDHRSNDTKCPRIKDYRAALTKSLLMNRPVPRVTTSPGPRLTSEDFPALGLAHMPNVGEQDYPRNQEQGSVGKIDQVLEKLEIIQKQMTSFTNFIDEKNKKDEILQNKIDQIELRASTMSDDLNATQTILLQLLDLLKSMTVNPEKATEDDMINRLNVHRTTLLNLLMKTVPCADNSK